MGEKGRGEGNGKRRVKVRERKREGKEIKLVAASYTHGWQKLIQQLTNSVSSLR